MGPVLRTLTTLVSLAAACAVAAAQEGPPADTAGAEFFEKRIRPLLAENCYQCHGDKKQESGFVVNNFTAILKGGDRGPPIMPGQPDQSLLIQAVRYTDDDLKMPPRGRLKDEQIADLVAWVKLGAPGPQEAAASIATVRPSSDFDLEERRQHWAYQPVRASAVPAVHNSAWCLAPVDRFILARLEAAGLSPAPPTDKRTLIRRVTFDLIGLPPTPGEVAAFLADSAPDAYERLVDRLLASPHYGERWARHWLDVVRYSETLGFEFDYDLYHAWRYRDYVIRAVSADLPYNQFVVEHLAGDLVPEPRRHPMDGTNESILATGFFWMHEGKQTPVDIRQEQADRIDNQIDVLGKALLGQTIACARCHDHKFDAISTRDYYALAGYLRSSRYQQAFIDPPERIAAKIAELAALKAKIRDRAASESAAAWLKELSQASRYLLATRTAESRKPKADEKESSALDALASEAGLDRARLQAWVKALRYESTSSPDHPLYAWAELSKQAEQTAETYRDRREALQIALRDQEEKAARAATSTSPFEAFRGTAFDGWYVTSDAFGAGPARVGDIVVGERPERPVARLATGGADSGLLSVRLQGELRSRTFTIDKRYVHLRLAGRNARVNLVIDGYTLIMNPMYGKLTAAPAGEGLVWQSMPVDRWIGQRAFIEISDCTIPMHGLNPPPSTARVPDSKGDGYIVLDQVLFSDDPDPPAAPSHVNLEALARTVVGTVPVPLTADGTPTHSVGAPVPTTDPAALAAAYQELMLQAVERWRSGQIETTNNGDDTVTLVNWLLENGLLDGAAPQATEPGADSLAGLVTQYRDLAAALPLPERTPALADGSGEDEFIFLRGNYRTPGEPAPRGPPEVLAESDVVHRGRARLLPSHAERGSAGASPSRNEAAGSGRLELAQRLVDPSNPLLPRVLVNRLWQHHFGEGIVRTPDDFGRMGQPPTHPELLDHLAAELVSRGWSIKGMHRRMVVSSTYRQSSRILDFGLPILDLQAENVVSPNPKSKIQNPKWVDPENRLLHHMPIRRLEAEAVRDAILAVSGRLNLTLHGASVLPFLTPYMEGRGRPNSGPLDGEGRRSIYINARRNFLTPLLLAFDYPVTFTPIGRRGTSSIPAQALTLMNDPFVVQEAARWADRVLHEVGGSGEQRIEALYQAAFARPPSAEEVQGALDFLEQQAIRHGGQSDDPRAWADLCHVLINVKEFIFID